MKKQKKSKEKKVTRKIKAPKVKAQNKRVKETSPKEKPIKEKLDPRVEEVYEKVIEFNCPVRGLVKQKVKVKRYKPLGEQYQKQLINSASELVNKLEERDNGLSIYDNGEDIGVTESTDDREDK